MNTKRLLETAAVSFVLGLSWPTVGSDTYKPPELSPDQVDRICKVVANNSSEVLWVNICPPDQVNKISTPAVTSTIAPTSTLALPPDNIAPIAKEVIIPSREITKKNEGLDNEEIWWLAILAALGLGWAFFLRRRKSRSHRESLSENDLRRVDHTVTEIGAWAEEQNFTVVHHPVETAELWAEETSIEKQKRDVLEMLKSLGIDTPEDFKQEGDFSYLKFNIHNTNEFMIHLGKTWELSIIQDHASVKTILAGDGTWYKLNLANDLISVSIIAIKIALSKIKQEMEKVDANITKPIFEVSVEKTPDQKIERSQQDVIKVLRELRVTKGESSDEHFTLSDFKEGQNWNTYINFKLWSQSLNIGINKNSGWVYVFNITRRPYSYLLSDKSWQNGNHADTVDIAIIQAALEQLKDISDLYIIKEYRKEGI